MSAPQPATAAESAPPPLPPPANGGPPQLRAADAAALLADLASRLSRCFGAGGVQPQLATDLNRMFPAVASLRYRKFMQCALWVSPSRVSLSLDAVNFHPARRCAV